MAKIVILIGVILIISACAVRSSGPETEKILSELNDGLLRGECESTLRKARRAKTNLAYFSETRLRVVAECEGTYAAAIEFRHLVEKREKLSATWGSRRVLSFLPAMREIIAQETSEKVQIESLGVLIDATFLIYDLSFYGLRGPQFENSDIYELVVDYWESRTPDSENDLGFYKWRSFFTDEGSVSQRHASLERGYQARLSEWLNACGFAWIEWNNRLTILEGVDCPAGHCLINPEKNTYAIRASASYVDRRPSYKTFNVSLNPGDILSLRAVWPGDPYGIWRFEHAINSFSAEPFALPSNVATATSCTNEEFSDWRFKRPPSEFEEWLAEKRRLIYYKRYD